MNIYLYFVLVCCIQNGLSVDRSDRLLVTDPSFLIDRLTQLEKTVHQQAATIQTQSAELQQLKNALNNTAKPAFFAVLGTSTSIGNSGNLKFDVVKTNTGGGYDVVTGVFIAPKPGTYQFTSIVYSNGNDDSVVQMNKNNDLLVRGYSTGKVHATSHTMNAVLVLQKGDHIYVQHRGVSSDAILGDLHSTFSGFMISE